VCFVSVLCVCDMLRDRDAPILLYDEFILYQVNLVCISVYFSVLGVFILSLDGSFDIKLGIYELC